MLSPEPTRKKYDSEDSKKRLLRSALNTFSKFGYDASTTKLLAKNAGLNESLIHRYFKNKLGLFFAVLREYHRSATSTLPYKEGGDLRAELLGFMSYRRDFGRENRKFIRLLITRAILDPKVREEMADLWRKGTPVLGERLEKLQRNGQLSKSVDLETLGLLLTSITFSMVMFTEVISTLAPEKGDAVRRLAVEVLCSALEPKSGN